MGYTLTIMQSTVGDLTQMQTSFGQLISALMNDASDMERATGDLMVHNFQGPKATSLSSMVLHYQTLLQSHAYDRLQQIQQICKTYQQDIESACATFDNDYPQMGDDFAAYVFATGALDNVPYALPHADQDVNSALSGTESAYQQQSEAKLTAKHIPLNRTFIMDIQDEISGTANNLYTWADALNTAFNHWQSALNGVDVHAVDIPTLTYDDGTGHLVSVPINTTYEQSLLNSFNQEGNSVITETLNPEAYLLLTQLKQVYPDPHTQAVLSELVSTPTGQKFAQYYLYMGKKLGPNFISWAHEGPNVGAETTYGGFVVMNLDENTTTAELAGNLVHEGVESYFDGQGIRQMGTRHADYLAEWYQGKFLNEAGGPEDTNSNGQPDGWRAYPLPYDKWWQKQKDIGSVYLSEDENVTIYSNGATLDSPGQYWPDNGNSVPVTGIPNPMGLDPRMLLSNDLRKSALPPIPPPPPQPRFPGK